jgi:hypothetical protein
LVVRERQRCGQPEEVVVSSFSHEDADLHFADVAHRWAAPDGVEKTVWEARVRAHIADHILAGWPPEPGYVRPYVPPSPAEDFLMMWFGPGHVDRPTDSAESRSDTGSG